LDIVLKLVALFMFYCFQKLVIFLIIQILNFSLNKISILENPEALAPLCPIHEGENSARDNAVSHQIWSQELQPADARLLAMAITITAEQLDDRSSG